MNVIPPQIPWLISSEKKYQRSEAQFLQDNITTWYVTLQYNVTLHERHVIIVKTLLNVVWCWVVWLLNA